MRVNEKRMKNEETVSHTRELYLHKNQDKRREDWIGKRERRDMIGW